MFKQQRFNYILLVVVQFIVMHFTTSQFFLNTVKGLKMVTQCTLEKLLLTVTQVFSQSTIIQLRSAGATQASLLKQVELE